MTENSVVIYDLDGTLVPFNSFKRWLIFTTVSALFFLNLDYCWLVFSTTMRRMFGKNIDRIAFKQIIISFHEQKSHRKFVKWCNFRFAVYLKKKTKTALLEKNKELYLATAAPDCYVKYYAELMNCFKNYSATHFLREPQETGSGIMNENIGVNKLIAVSQQLGEQISTATLYTDHEDDIPLAEKVSRVFLVNASEKTKRAFSGLEIVKEFV